MHKTTWLRGLNVLLIAATVVGWIGGCGRFASHVWRIRKDRVEQAETTLKPGPGDKLDEMGEGELEKARNDLRRAQEAYGIGDLDEAVRAIRSGYERLVEMDSEAPEAVALFRSLEEWYDRIIAALKEASAESSIPVLLKQLEEEIEAPSPPSEESVVAEIVAGCDLPIDTNRRVRQGIRYFRTTGRKVFRIWLARSGRYLPMIRKIFEEEGLPLDLSYLAMVESGLNPEARSWADARGLWQFIGSTGRVYGLKQTWWLDERLDPVKATRAAARHLKDLKRQFGDWRLAIAAYNCGSGRMRRAMRRAQTKDFWRLRLPQETRNYVPSFMAVAILSKRPEIFGFGDVIYQEPLAFDDVSLDGCTDLRMAARWVSSSYQTLKALNPELRRWCTPPGVEGYRLKLPKGTALLFLSQAALVPDSEKIEWQRHRVRRGEVLSRIARQYRVPMQQIVKVNALRNPHRLRVGQVLLIPVPRQEAVLLTEHSFQSPPKRTGESRVASKSETHYVVRRGDTLSEIAQRHGTTVRNLRRWNGLQRSLIRPGERLIISR